MFVNYRNWLICAGLVVCCLAIYGQTLGHDFVNYDDGLYVTDNAEVQAGLGWSNVVWAFTTDRAMYMHPLTWMSHMLDCNLYGMHAWGHHLTNLLFHTFNSVLLFLVLARMTGFAWPSALAAALFAVHPLHVESVAWIAERKDVLSMLFWTAGIGAYAWHRQRPGLGRYLAVAALFLLGFMSKPMVVTFPFVLLLLDYWPLGRVDRTASAGGMARAMVRLAAEKIPLFLMTAAMCAVTVIMQMRGKNLGFGEMVPMTARCANAVVVYVLYLVKTVWPFGLAVYYPHPITRPAWQVAGAAVVLIVVTLVCVREMRRRPCLIVGWLWYLGTLVPVIELVQAGTFSHADRYTYIPLIGIFIMVAWSLNDLLESGRVPKPVAAFVPALAVAALTVAAVHQTGYWKNGETLFRHALAVTADNPEVHNKLGGALYANGKPEEANSQFQYALQLDPSDSTALNKMGLLLYEKGKYEEAAARHREALALNPNFEPARKNLLMALRQLGKLDAPIAEYSQLLKKNPKSADDYCRLGTLAMTLGGGDEAFDAFAQALKMEPDGKKVNLAIADALVEQQKHADALGYYEKALKADPHDAQTLYNMGVVLSGLRRPAEAAEKYREALQWKPDFAQAHNNLGSLSANAQRLDEAVEHYRKAIVLDPNYAQARVNLASLLAFKGQIDEAVGLYEEAIRIKPDAVGARLGLARLLVGNHRGTEAEAQLKKVLELEPGNAEAQKLTAGIGAEKLSVPASEKGTP
jgi:tetratricopeptide (TPR) repeat protein